MNTPSSLGTLLARASLMSLCSALLTACGGGGDSPAPLPPATYSVGGSVSGLWAGARITLQLNGGESVVVQNPGALDFSFPTPLADATAYNVTLDSANSDLNCRIDHGTGSVSGTAVHNVQVRCADVFAFVPNVGAGGGISRYAMGSDGQLTALGTTPAGNPQHVALSFNGKYAYVANGSDANILQFKVETDGSLTPLSPAAVGAGTATSHYVNQVAIDDSHVWATNWDEGRIYQFSMSANGTLTPMSTPWVWGPARPDKIVYDGNCKCVIVTETRLDGDTQVFDVAADGSLHFKMTYGAAGSANSLLLLSPRGLVYVAGQNQIARWNLSSRGALTGFAATPSDWTRALAADPNGQVIWALSQGRSSIRPYSVGADGGLTAGAEITSGGLSRPTAIASNGRHVYVTNSIGNTVSQFAVNSLATGALAPLSTPTVTTGNTPNGITLY